MSQHNQNDRIHQLSREISAYEKMYLKERSRAKLFMIASAVLGILFIGALVINPKAEQTNIANFPGGNPGSSSQLPLGGGPGSGGPNISAKNFIKSDGSVDTAQIENLTANIPAQFKSTLLSRIEADIESSEKSGDISNAQATELRKAFGL